MPWCRIVKVDGKQVLFTNTRSKEGDHKVAMSIQAEDFGGKEDTACLSVHSSKKSIPFTEFLGMANETTARRMIAKYITPYLERLQCS